MEERVTKLEEQVKFLCNRLLKLSLELNALKSILADEISDDDFTMSEALAYIEEFCKNDIEKHYDEFSSRDFCLDALTKKSGKEIN